MNVPQMTWRTYKNHEQEIGPVVEEMARNSCQKAAVEEKNLTITNLEKIQALL